MRKIIFLILILALAAPAFGQFLAPTPSYKDSIGIYSGGGWNNWIYPAFLRPGTNITFGLAGDTLTITGAGGASGTGDTLIINDGTAEYSIINNTIKLKEGTGIGLEGSDSTAYDVITINHLAHTGDVTGSTALSIADNAVKENHIDWGTGANQVSTDDIPEGATNKFNTFGSSIDGNEITDQTITKSDVDTTSSNFPFNDAFRGTTAEPESLLATRDQVKQIVHDTTSAIDSTHIGDDHLSLDDINWRLEYINLSTVHGQTKPLEDSIWITIPPHNLVSSWMATDTAGNITASDRDTLFISGMVPYTVDVDSLIFTYRNNTANSSIIKYTLWGPDRSSFVNLTDSCYYGRLTDSTTARTATSWTRVAIDVNDFTAYAGERFAIKFIDDFQADNTAVQYGPVMLAVKR